MWLLGLLPLLLTCGCQSLLQSSVPHLPPFDFVHRVEMDQVGSYFLYWTPREKDVVFEVQVRTKGYIGLGFSSNGFMKDADIVIGWIDGKGVVHFSDRHAPGYRTPVEDDSQDYELLGGYSNSSHTVIRFSRPWVTCDKMHDYPLTEDTVRVLWAYDAVKPDPLVSTLNMHDHRGSRSLYLKEPKMNSPPKKFKGKTWDIRSPQVRIPPMFNTLYWCKLYKMPSLPWKHQVIGFLPLIDPGSLPHVHHMLLYECNLRNSQKHMEKWVNESGAQCYNVNMPISWNSCDTPIVAWAIGSQGEMFPEDVGFPIGEEHGGADYFLLEIHYDNPDLKEGIVDSSGVRLLLTDELRRYDAGVLTVGHKVEPSMMIPPQRLWTTRAHCTSDCTQKTIPEEGIKVFSGTLHAHLLGHSISLQHIRDGNELKPLVKDDNYDFNYQQARIFGKERVVKPGDHLIMNCRYNATKRRKPTFGGLGTEEEMCLAFLSYYPKINLGVCYSRPDISLLFVAFGIQDLYDVDKVMYAFDKDYFDESEITDYAEYRDHKTMSQSSHAGEVAKPLKLVYFFKIVNVSEPESLRGKTFFDIVTSDSTWRDRNLISRLEDVVNKQQYEPRCFYNGRVLVQGLPKKAKVPHFFDYKEVSESCHQMPNRSILQQTSTFIPPVEEESVFIQGKLTGKVQDPDKFNKEPKKAVQERNLGRSFTSSTSWILLLFLVCLLNT